jgi:hypothetical protein
MAQRPAGEQSAEALQLGAKAAQRGLGHYIGCDLDPAREGAVEVGGSIEKRVVFAWAPEQAHQRGRKAGNLAAQGALRPTGIDQGEQGGKIARPGLIAGRACF